MGKQAFRAASILAMAMSMAACANTVRGGPARIHNVIAADRDYAGLEKAISNACFKKSTTTIDEAERNKWVHGYLLLADRRYNGFESALLNENRGGNFFASALSLGLSTAGSLASESAAQTLTTIDTGVKGASQSYGKEFLFSQTVPALINQMRASRAEKKVDINRGLRASVEAWPLCSAMQSLAAYEQAGTLTSAITRLTASTVKDKDKQEADAKLSDPVKFEKGALQEVFFAYLDPDLPRSEYNRRSSIVTRAMLKVNPDRAPSDVLKLHASSSSELKEIIEEARKIESDGEGLGILYSSEGG